MGMLIAMATAPTPLGMMSGEREAGSSCFHTTLLTCVLKERKARQDVRNRKHGNDEKGA